MALRSAGRRPRASLPSRRDKSQRAVYPRDRIAGRAQTATVFTAVVTPIGAVLLFGLSCFVMRRDLRHAGWVLAVLVPAAAVATLFTSGNAPVRPPKRIPTTIAALVRADNREHAEAIDVLLDRRIKLLKSDAN